MVVNGLPVPMKIPDPIVMPPPICIGVAMNCLLNMLLDIYTKSLDQLDLIVTFI